MLKIVCFKIVILVFVVLLNYSSLTYGFHRSHNIVSRYIKNTQVPPLSLNLANNNDDCNRNELIGSNTTIIVNNSRNWLIRGLHTLVALLIIQVVAVPTSWAYNAVINSDPAMATTSSVNTIMPDNPFDLSVLVNGLVSGALVRITKELVLHPIDTIKYGTIIIIYFHSSLLL